MGYRKPITLALSVLSLLYTVASVAQNKEIPLSLKPPVMREAVGGMGHGAGAGMGMHHMTPEQLEKLVNRWMVKINGTTEQTRQITQLALAAQNDLNPLHEKMSALHAKHLRALLGEAVDRDALEMQRKEGLQIHEQISQRMTKFMADAAQVLTAEQRVQMSKRLEEHRTHMDEMQKNRHLPWMR